jgi:hypothetical protein
MIREATCLRCKHTFPIPEGETGRELICPHCNSATEQPNLWPPTASLQRDPPLAAKAAVQTGPPVEEQRSGFLHSAASDKDILRRPTVRPALFQVQPPLPLTVFQCGMAPVGLGAFVLLMAGWVIQLTIWPFPDLEYTALFDGAFLFAMSIPLGALRTRNWTQRWQGPPLGAATISLWFLLAVLVWEGILTCIGFALFFASVLVHRYSG